jgi:hypothetical protein
MNNMNTSNNNTTRHGPSVPDLLSFDSWDYDSTIVSATSSFTDPSYDENDHHHHRHHSSASISSSSMTPAFATDDIHIQVSGASFILNPAVFQKLEKLPWTVINFNDNNVMYSLGTSPDLFEILVNYVLFESLPDMKLLSQSDIEELEPMVLITGLQGLQNHLEKKDLKNKLLLRNRSFRRNPSTAVPAQELQQQLKRHIITNSMNNGSSKNGKSNDKDNSNNKVLRREISAPVLGASSTHETLHSNNSHNIKGMASRLVQAVSRRRPSKQQQNLQGRKLTHAQCIASGLVD